MNKILSSLSSLPALALALALASLSSGCGSTSSDAPGTTGLDDAGTGGPDGTVTVNTPLPCDVNAVVVEHCQTRHANPPQNGAPMPLVTWEDFQAKTPADALGPNPITGTYVYQTAQFRIGDNQAPMPQPPNARLDAADMATMNAWFNAGAPKTDGATCGGGGEDGGGSDGSVVVTVPDAAPPTVTCNENNVTLTPASPWTMPASESTEYVCYLVTVPVADAGTSHVLAITPNIDNHKIVHHVLLFQAAAGDPNAASLTSTPQACQPFGSLGWRIVYGWAPGGGPMETPPNVGFPYDSTTQWIVQVHYNNPTGLSGETDTSGFSFCSTDKPVQYDADVVAFGTENISIPALSSLDETCSVPITASSAASVLAGAHLFAAFPHMHLLGTAIQTEQVMSGGGIGSMAQNDPWDFNAQIWFPINTTLSMGDTVNTRCAWQNSTTETVTFGPATTNEMCYSFTAYYPRIASLSQWDLPAASSTCAPTVGSTLPTPDAGWESDGSFGAYVDAGGD
ncbi:MAG: hypothetical protein ACLQBL_23250 [Polyangiaceae bacterium]